MLLKIIKMIFNESFWGEIFQVFKGAPVGGRIGGRGLKMEGLLEATMLPRKDEEARSEATRGPG